MSESDISFEKSKVDNKKLSLLFRLGVIACILIGWFGGYLFWQEEEVTKDKIATEASLKSVKIELEGLKKNIGPSLTSTRLLERAIIFRTEWSSSLVSILSLFSDKIIIRELSTQEGRTNKFSFSATAKDWKTIAVFLIKMKGDPRFTQVFLNTIGEYALASGDIGLKFNVSFLINK